jgi:DNA polymerase-4
MGKDRVILHCDLNSFFASVECIANPALKDVPMAVAGDPTRRHGIILAKNEKAKAYGIVTAETIWKAKKKCPDLILVAPSMNKYSHYSKLANEIYQRFTDLVEPFGIDESWLDVTATTGLFGMGPEIADKIRELMRTELGLSVSVGASFNKIFAKLGSDYKKPDATTVISRETGKLIVYPLPVTDLLFVGRSSAEVLAVMGIKTIGQLAKFDRDILVSKLGIMGGQLHDYACGLDESPVGSIYDKHDVKSVGNGTTFTYDLTKIDEIRAGVTMLCDSVGSRLRQANMKCRTVQVTIKDPEFRSIQRQKQLDNPTHSTRSIIKAAMELIKEKWPSGKPIRSITITAARLVDENTASIQTSLLDKNLESPDKLDTIDNTIDNIRNKFGDSAIKFGVNIKPKKSRD